MKTFRELCTEQDVACPTALSQDLPRANKGNYENFQAGCLISEAKFEPGDLTGKKQACQPLHCHVTGFAKWVRPVNLTYHTYSDFYIYTN
jgi:hypothetical protein